MKSVHKKIILFACAIFCSFTLSLTVSADNGSTIVYVTDSGEKYHTAGCQYLSKSKNSITLEEASEEGYSPCSRCNPPIYDGGYDSEISSIENENNSDTSENVAKDTDEYNNQRNSNSDLRWAPSATRKVWVENKTIHLIDCPKAGDSHVTMELGDVTKDFEPCDYCKPLQYMSMSDRMGMENKSNAVMIGSAIITIAIVIYAASKISKRNKPNHKDAPRQAKQIDEPKIPNGFDIVDGLPATVGHHHRYGLYSVYVTPSGSHYHRRKKCAGSHAHLTNLYLVYQKRKPCSNCCQNYRPNMDFTWYEKYMNFQKENN